MLPGLSWSWQEAGGLVVVGGKQRRILAWNESNILSGCHGVRVGTGASFSTPATNRYLFFGAGNIQGAAIDDLVRAEARAQRHINIPLDKRGT